MCPFKATRRFIFILWHDSLAFMYDCLRISPPDGQNKYGRAAKEPRRIDWPRSFFGDTFHYRKSDIDSPLRHDIIRRPKMMHHGKSRTISPVVSRFMLCLMISSERISARFRSNARIAAPSLDYSVATHGAASPRALLSPLP